MYSCAGPEPRGRSQARPFLACCDSVLAPASMSEWAGADVRRSMSSRGT